MNGHVSSDDEDLRLQRSLESLSSISTPEGADSPGGLEHLVICVVIGLAISLAMYGFMVMTGQWPS